MVNERDIRETISTRPISTLLSVQQLSHDLLKALVDIEGKGMGVNLGALYKLKQETIERIDTLESQLYYMAEQTMGDTPINLSSPEQLSMLVFSRRVVDKSKWKSNLGFFPNQTALQRVIAIGNVTEGNFKRVVQQNTEIVYKTVRKTCSLCNAVGKIKKKMVSSLGKEYHRVINCPQCSATGMEYKDTESIGGFRVTPKKKYLSSLGFKASEDIIEELLEENKISRKAREFLTLLNEYRKLKSYLATGIIGIEKGLVGNILHANFNQCGTQTGRLSSSKPNVQNFPRGDTFPLKRVFVSKFENGLIADADLGQLEFRVAAYLSGCAIAIEFINSGKDIHLYSASKLFNIPTTQVTKAQRTEAKAYTFKPLYGGKDWGLRDLFPGIGKWHNKLIDEAVRTGQLVLPSGRLYKFGNVRRTQYGCTNQTKIKNYPVQGFASADVVPALIVELHKELKEWNSHIVSSIHDSVIVDVHPEEKRVLKIIYDVMNKGNKIIKDRFNIDLPIDLVSDLAVGVNGQDTEEITFE